MASVSNAAGSSNNPRSFGSIMRRMNNNMIRVYQSGVGAGRDQCCDSQRRILIQGDHSQVAQTTIVLADGVLAGRVLTDGVLAGGVLVGWVGAAGVLVDGVFFLAWGTSGASPPFTVVVGAELLTSPPLASVLAAAAAATTVAFSSTALLRQFLLV
ncbi:hypothetical protein Ahy_B10g101268 [Arachis hypogaea]|uniref:Uncharacterized protein n=1 Tax=Arachis hypogaea TaxID=3818 RepID=A0A444WZ90_ARAHY|nr:hypothetical protein Ahy_B10g101268 [Arachis hypogaea]